MIPLLLAAILSAPGAWPPDMPVAQPIAHAPTTAPASVGLRDLGDGRWWAEFRVRPPAGTTAVFLAGDFNGWNPSATPMESGNHGSFVISLALDEGVRTYKFVINGDQWITDPRNNDRVSDGQGGDNSVLRLGSIANVPSGTARRGDGEVDAIGLGHDPDSPRYRQRTATGWLIRLRTFSDDVEGVEFVASDGSRQLMHSVMRDERFEWWEAVRTAEKETEPGSDSQVRSDAIGYTFVLTDGGVSVRDPEQYELNDDTRLMRTPDWAKDAIWYQIMVDRFRNGETTNDPDPVRPWTSEWYSSSDWEGGNGQTFYDWYVFTRLYGGDLSGLKSKLDYLADLGVNALYLNPIFQSPSHHKYNATSFIHIDENYGAGSDYTATEQAESLLDPSTWTFNASDQIFLDFLKAAKARGFRVIIDGVFNHVGTSHPAFRDVEQHGEASPFASWFSVKSWDPLDYEGWAGFKELPVFRKDDSGLADDAVKAHIFAITKRWMDPDGDGDPSDGIDGWRLDVPNEVAMPFWHDWCAYVRSINPEAYISGEIWHRAEEWLDGKSFDAVMNYPFAETAVAWIGNREQKITATEIDQRLAELRLAYPAEATYVLQNLVGSHDTDRIASSFQNPDRQYDEGNREQQDPTYDASKPPAMVYQRVRLLLMLQMTYVGAPMVYYGDEVGMWGSDDPTNRKPMLWHDLEPYDDGHENHVMDEQHAFFRQMIHLRRDLPALRRGSFRTILVHDEMDLWVFLRETDEQQVLVALNASDSEQTVRVPFDDQNWRPAFSSGPESFPQLVLPAVSGSIWVRSR